MASLDLKGPQRVKLSEALGGAFTVQRLREALDFKLEKRLEDISVGGDYAQIRFEVIQAAEAQGWTTELVVAAREENPGNAPLLAFAEEVGLAGAHRGEGVIEHPAPGVGPPFATETPSRRTVSVVFFDVTAAGDVGEHFDPESLGRVMARCFEELTRIVDHHGGTIQRFPGNAAMAVFGIPTLHEDDATRAIRATAEARAALTRLSDDLWKSWRVTLEMRTGVDTGEVVIGDPSREDAWLTGEAVTNASRLAQAAAPGEALLGDATYRRVHDAVKGDALESLNLPGRTDPQSAFKLREVTARAPGVARRLDSPMVGREWEYQILERAFQRAIDTRRCVLATVLGPAGVGKSRLTHEFVSGLGDRARVLHGRCLPYGDGITYWPVAEVVKQAAGVSEEDSRNEARAKIAALLLQDEDAGPIAKGVGGALGLTDLASPPGETFWAVRRFLEGLAVERPLVVVFDDIHWGEATFLDLIEYIARVRGAAPVMLLCMARSELREERASLGDTGASVTLEALDSSESRRLIENFLGDAQLPEEASGQIAEAAEGNPFFVEEMLRMLVADGLLRRENGGWRVTGDLSSLRRMPPTISDLLGARLNRLKDQERVVLDRGAVIGQEFWAGAVRELLGEDARTGLEDCLHTLVRKDLVRPGGTVFAGEEGFRFAHVLIREVAYRALLKEACATLHERFADWLEQRAGERVSEYEEVLGYHLEQAYRCSRELLEPLDERARSLAWRAAERLMAAGRRAFARTDMPATVNLYERAAALLPDGDRTRHGLLPDLAHALRETGELSRAKEVVTEAVEAAQSTGDRRLELHARIERAFGQLYDESAVVAEEMVGLAELAIPFFGELRDEAGLARAWHLLGEAHLAGCQGRASVEAFEHALVHARRAGDRRQEAQLLSWIAGSHYWGPTPVREATRRNEDILEHAQGEHVVTSSVFLHLAGLKAMEGRFSEARELYKQGRAIAEELGLTFAVAAVPLFSASVELLAGDPAAAERDLRSGYETLADMGETGVRSTIAAFLAESLYAQGRYEESERFTRASEEAAARDDVLSQVQWRGTRAKLLARRGELEEAGSLAHEAVALARRTDYLNLRGRAAMDLADVLELSTDSKAARPLIEEALELFDAKGNRVATSEARRRLKELL